MQLFGLTIHVLGEVLVAFTAIRVHYRFRKEHKIDDRVFKAMRREHVLGILGIALILAGYLIRMLAEF